MQRRLIYCRDNGSHHIVAVTLEVTIFIFAVTLGVTVFAVTLEVTISLP